MGKNGKESTKAKERRLSEFLATLVLGVVRKLKEEISPPPVRHC
jgi:hypothetical protein